MSGIRGKVKWFNRLRGFGFIESGECERDVFVHYSQIDGAGFAILEEGDHVRFDLVEFGKGPQAVNVRRHAWS